MSISLIYFNFPFWRAEISRIALHHGDIKFVDIRISREKFQKVKSEGVLDNGVKIPFHQLPCLLIEDQVVAQTGGIARYCGKLSNLYPSNCISAAKVDQFMDFASDITSYIIFTKSSNRDNKFLKEIKKKLFILNKLIQPEAKFLVDNTMSVSDLAIWSLMNWLQYGISGLRGSLQGIPENILDEFENIRRIYSFVGKDIKLQAWVNKTYSDEYKKHLINF